MSQIMAIMTHNSSLGFCVSHRNRSNLNKPLKIRKIGSCNEKNHLSRKILYWNRTWSHTPQNTSESRRNKGERLETLEKQGCRTQNALKITVVGIRQERQVVGEDHQQRMMLKEEARRRRCPQAPTRGEQGKFLWWHVWFTRTPSDHRT